MNAESQIYWTHLAAYEKCPQLFLWDFGWDGIDLGQGPGKPKRFEGFVESRHRQVMGIVIDKVIEKLYAEEVYRDSGNVLKILEAAVEREWIHQTLKKSNPINYDRAGKSAIEMIEECKEAVRGFLKTMQKHRLLGPYAKAQLWLSGSLNRWMYVAGYADLVVRRDDTGITILDLKDTPHKNKFTDPDQVRWYALTFWRSYGQLPDRIGFVWLRFPAGSRTKDANGVETEEEGVEWIPFDEKDLRGLAQRAVDARDGMRRRKFEALPDPTSCRRCRWEPVCPSREEQRGRNSIRRHKSSLDGIPDDDGFTDLEP